jgi:hypothetical protein
LNVFENRILIIIILNLKEGSNGEGGGGVVDKVA